MDSEKQIDLRFIHDDRLRAILLRDATELDSCLKAGAHKSAVVLAGSIIEAVLVDHFLADPGAWKGPKAVLECEMGLLLASAKTSGVMSEKALGLSGVVKDYRNLLHPGREVRTKETPDADSAVVARALVNIVIRDVLATYQKHGGVTAQSAFEKMEQDPTATSIVPYLLERMSPIERESLLKAIPDRCCDEEENGTGDAPQRIRWLEATHKVLRSIVPEATIKAHVEALDNVLTNHNRFRLNHTLRFWKDELSRASKRLRIEILRYAIQLASGSEVDEKAYWHRHCGYSFVGRYIDADCESFFWSYLNNFRWRKGISPLDNEILNAMCGGLERPIAEAYQAKIKDWSDGPIKEMLTTALADIPF